MSPPAITFCRTGLGEQSIGCATAALQTIEFQPRQGPFYSGTPYTCAVIAVLLHDASQKALAAGVATEIAKSAANRWLGAVSPSSLLHGGST